jgi:cell division protein FtsL
MSIAVDPRTLRIVTAVLLALLVVVMAFLLYERQQTTSRIESRIEDLQRRIDALQPPAKGAKRQPEQKK